MGWEAERGLDSIFDRLFFCRLPTSFQRDMGRTAGRGYAAG